MGSILFLTHPEVVVDPAIPVPRWPRSEIGRARMHRFVDEVLIGRPPAAVWSSDERKALDGAAIIGARMGVEHLVDPLLGENDRSATGFVEAPAFWEIVAEFFGEPDRSACGWATARDEQARIVGAVRAVSADPVDGDVVVVSHGGVGRLLAAHLDGVRIEDSTTQPHEGGGCWFEIDRASFTRLSAWRAVRDGAPD